MILLGQVIQTRFNIKKTLRKAADKNS